MSSTIGPLVEAPGVAFPGQVGSPAMRPALVPAVLAAMVFLVACGESSEEKAKKDVCSARAGIQEEVQNLQNLSIETATLDSVKNSLSSIQTDLQKMKDAES